MYTGQKPLFLMYIHIDLHIYLHPLFGVEATAFSYLKPFKAEGVAKVLALIVVHVVVIRSPYLEEN